MQVIVLCHRHYIRVYRSFKKSCARHGAQPTGFELCLDKTLASMLLYWTLSHHLIIERTNIYRASSSDTS